jgi:RNA polymerase sigma-70 factor (ECF subfamily)
VTSDTGFVSEVRELWDRDHARLWRSLLGWSGSAEVASEASAEAFAQLLRRGREVEYPDRWVWRAAFRIAAGLLQTKRSEAIGVPIDVVAPGAEPGESLALVEALRTLSESDRRVVVLSLLAGWTAEEIGALDSTSAGAVPVRLHRARRQLRARLEVRDG